MQRRGRASSAFLPIAAAQSAVGVHSPGVQPQRARVFTDPGDQTAALRIGGLLALVSAALGVVLAVGVSSWSAADNRVLLPLLLAVAAVGAGAVLRPERMRPAAAVATLVLGTAFISVGMVVVGGQGVDGADNEMLFLLPVLYSAYFCRPWVTALVTTSASTSYGTALLLLGAAQPAARWTTTTGALCLVGTLVTIVRDRDVRRIAHLSDEAGRDALTGLLNRRGLSARARRAAGADDLVSLLVVDLDHFKTVNDRHGHAVGDAVLALVAQELRRGLRADDLVARLGGEEFAVVLLGCDTTEALQRAAELRGRVAQLSADWPAPVTLSVGAATTQRGTADLTALLERADRALYAAKAGGRNTVRMAAVAVPDHRSTGAAPRDGRT